MRPEGWGGSTTDPFLVLRGITKTYGSEIVLRGLDLEVARGERVAIIGRSGSGKTTLLRLVMALERPTSGNVILGSTPTWPEHDRRGQPTASERHLRHVRTNIGMVFQQFNLFPTMTARQNVAEGPRHVLRLSRNEAEKRACDLLERVGLSKKLDRYPSELSGGEQQRVAIARALAMGPEVMLFDEITSALDPELVGEVLDVLRELAVDSGVTMLIVTHEIAFAREVADRVVFLADGEIAEQGPPRRLLDDPTDMRTKAFLDAVLRR